MNNQQMNCTKKGGRLKYLLVGVGAGVAAGVAGKILVDNNMNVIQKKADKVADAMENLLDSAKEMFQ